MQRTVLLKLSGEALRGDDGGILSAETVGRVCGEIAHGLAHRTHRVALVIGGGNILRGATRRHGDDPTRGDYMGMLATLINSLALLDGFEQAEVEAMVFAPYEVPNVARAYRRAEVIDLLDRGGVAIFGGGTGHPFFTTDTTAALRAAEIGASELLKGSNVDGVYTADPRVDADALRLDHLTFDEAVEGGYGVMDAAAFAICRDQRVRIRIFDMTKPGTIAAALGPNPPGTLVGEPR